MLPGRAIARPRAASALYPVELYPARYRRSARRIPASEYAGRRRRHTAPPAIRAGRPCHRAPRVPDAAKPGKPLADIVDEAGPLTSPSDTTSTPISACRRTTRRRFCRPSMRTRRHRLSSPPVWSKQDQSVAPAVADCRYGWSGHDCCLSSSHAPPELEPLVLPAASRPVAAWLAMAGGLFCSGTRAYIDRMFNYIVRSFK